MFFQPKPTYVVHNYCSDISKILVGLSYVEKGDDLLYSTYNPNQISKMFYGWLEEDEAGNELFEDIEPMLYGTHIESDYYEYAFHSESYDIWKTMTEIPTEDFEEDEAIYQMYHDILRDGLEF